MPPELCCCRTSGLLLGATAQDAAQDVAEDAAPPPLCDWFWVSCLAM
jgi:hypothetical protein